MRLRRILVFGAVILCLVTGLPAHPQGQRRPTLSGELTHLRGDRIRLIVQPATEGDVSSLRGRLRGIVRRELEGSVALEVSRADFEAMSQDSSFAHISADAPVVADMAITNKVTGASAMWQGTSGLLGLLSTAGYDGTGIGVAVVDSGIAPHSALDSRVVARVNFVSWERSSGGDLYGHGTHVAGIIGGNTSAAKYVTTAFAGGSAPGVKLIDVRVLGSAGVGYTSDVIAGIDWAVANRSKKIADTGLIDSLLNTVDSLLGTSSGATFRDTGTLIDRIYDRTGIRLLGLLDLSILFGSADYAEPGVLNLLGLSNPLGQTPANHLVWGDVADWTDNYQLVWGDTIESPSGQHLVWGDSEHTDSNHLVWGDAVVDGGQ